MQSLIQTEKMCLFYRILLEKLILNRKFPLKTKGIDLHFRKRTKLVKSSGRVFLVKKKKIFSLTSFYPQQVHN